MPGSSKNGLWVYLDDDMLEPDYPVSTAMSWQLRDNLAHLIDSQCQTRISWMGSLSRYDHFTLPAGQDAYYAVEFPLTVFSDEYLVGLRIVQWIYSNDAANTVTSVANLRWASEPLFQNGTGSAGGLSLWGVTNSTTSTTGQKKANVATPIRDADNHGRGWQSFSIEENSDDHTTRMRMARLEIAMSDTAGDGGGLVGLQVIEFPMWP